MAPRPKTASAHVPKTRRPQQQRRINERSQVFRKERRGGDFIGRGRDQLPPPPPLVCSAVFTAAPSCAARTPAPARGAEKTAQKKILTPTRARERRRGHACRRKRGAFRARGRFQIFSFRWTRVLIESAVQLMNGCLHQRARSRS